MQIADLGRVALLALLLSASASLAQEPQHRDGPPPSQQQQQQPQRHASPPTADSVTNHEITIGGRKLAYTATAGTLELKDDDSGQPTAQIFYVSFTLKDAGDPAHRPVTYLFNGGPGAASAYLDIGAAGPRALVMNDDGSLPLKSDKVADNPDTWLSFSDLVFIDPVGTGWSRATDPDKGPKEFWGVEQDIDTLADIIRLHLTQSGRLGSPIYIAGESYGGLRAARLARELPVGRGIPLAGVVMVSPVIDYDLMSNSNSPLPWALRLPSMAAAVLGPTALQSGAGALDDAEYFALHAYVLALVQGPPEGAATDALYKKLAALTGIDEARIALWHGRIPTGAFLGSERLRDGRVASAYDATETSLDPNPTNDNNHDDPGLAAATAPFTSGFVAYARDELGYKTDLPFELLNFDVERHWDWGGNRGQPQPAGSSNGLRRALAVEPQLKVMIAHGVSDTVTPYMMSRYIRSQMPPALGQRIALKLYLGGHMLYLRAASRHALHDDVAAFYGAGEN